METAQSYWDARSELFGNYYKQPSLFDTVFRKSVFLRQAIAMRACKEIGNASVLDIGSGPGVVSVSLIKNANARHVTGIDFAEQMIIYANSEVKKEGVADKCKFILGDIFTYDFHGETFDFSLALGVFDYVGKAKELIMRMNELTTGSFVISWPKNGLRMALRRYRYTCPVYHYSLDDIKRLHNEAGIKNLVVITTGAGWITVAKK
jgi:2-polyprenyl-3-methyl-5-hydroxy-6-metoxy-1,4-benzoquinol methylase